MKLFLAIFLAISFLENFKVHIIRGTVGTQTMAVNSCVNLYSKQITIRRISDYEIQNHPQKVVIFITKKGIKICVPHDLPWVNRTMISLDERKAAKQKGIIARFPHLSK